MSSVLVGYKITLLFAHQEDISRQDIWTEGILEALERGPEDLPVKRYSFWIEYCQFLPRVRDLI